MLFDLRGRGRRRIVRVIYVGLALLFGVGLVGFGVGGGGSGGGILNAFTGNEGSNSASFSNQIKKYRKLAQEQPSNVSAWENLTKNILHEAGNEAYVTSAGAVTSKGKELFKQAAQAWSGYIALNSPKPNAELAQLMESVYSVEGLNEPAKEVEILQIVVAARPTYVHGYEALAEYAYKAKNTRVGDLASEKAVSLAPAAQRKQLKAALAAIKKNPSGKEGSTTATSTSTGTSVGSNGTVTVGGKTYQVNTGSTAVKQGTAAGKTSTSKP
jgi:hypothetical protein